MNNPVVLSVENISKHYGRFQALDGVSFNVEEKTIFGLLGSNGAGKSTLLHIMTGLLNPSEGDVRIFGQSVGRFDKKLKRRVAIVPQKISLYNDMSIYHNLYFFAKAYGYKRKEIVEKINKYSEILKLGDTSKKIKDLSGGYKRRTSLAVGLIGDPRVLILDEALVGIDLETKKIIVDLLKALKRQITIIITTHSIKEAEEVCDTILFLHRGEKVLEGRTLDVIQSYSRKKGVLLDISFSNHEIASKIADQLVHPELNIVEKELKRNNLRLKVKKEKSTGEEPILKLIDFIRNFPQAEKAITNLEINSPNLEDVMLDIIR